MTEYQKSIIAENINKFTCFMDFHKFSNDHLIEFEFEEWEFYRDILHEQSNKNLYKNINFTGIVMPNQKK